MLEKIRKILHYKRKTKQEYPLKFYETMTENRYTVKYKDIHICTCDKKQKQEVLNYFNENYNGKNIYEISDKLKKRYNIKIQNGKTYPKGKGKSKKSKKVNYKTAKLCFNPTPDNRLQVKVRDKGKTHTVCNCYPYQKEEVLEKYNMLKKKNNLDTIKIILKEDYNLRKRK